jgi:hypothetical protein
MNTMKYSRLRLWLLLCLVIAGLLPGLSSSGWQGATQAAQDEQKLRKQSAVARKKMVQQLVIEHRDKLSPAPPRQQAGDETAPALVGPCDPSYPLITINQTLTGQLTTSDCSIFVGDGTFADIYSFSGTANQQVAISLGSVAFDAYLYLCDSNGTVITQDDDGGGGTNARIPANSGVFTLPGPGPYLIVVNTLFVGQTGNYQLSVRGPASAGLQFYPLSKPIRLLDTRAGTQFPAFSKPNTPITGQTSYTQQGRTQPGALLTYLDVTIPAEAQALVGTVTTRNSPQWNFLTFYPSDELLPLAATINPTLGRALTNVFTVRLGPDGAFKIYAYQTTDVVVDVTGYYAPPSTGGLYFHPLPSPVRLLETRPGFLDGCYKPGEVLGLSSTTTYVGRGGPSPCSTIPAAAQALVGNATTVFPQGNGELILFPDWNGSSPPPRITSSSYLTSEIMNAQFIVRLNTSGNFWIYTNAETHLVVDVVGYYSAEASDANGPGLLFSPLPSPARLLETRPGELGGCYLPAAPLAHGSTRLQAAGGFCTIPSNAQGIIGHATYVYPAAIGWLTFYPSHASLPTVATTNYDPNYVPPPGVAVLLALNQHFTVGLGNTDQAFKIYTYGGTHLVVDVTGYFFAP